MYTLYYLRLKCLVKDIGNLFWSLCFPIILATLFHAAFANLGTAETFQTVPVAVVSDAEKQIDESFLSAIKGVELSNNCKLFDVTICDQNKAKELLDKDEITGYIVPADSMKLIVKNSGLEETIIKSFLDNYAQKLGTIQSVMKAQPNVAISQLIADISRNENFIIDQSSSGAEPNNTLVYFYSLIAMACLFGSNWGFKEICDIQADLSSKGARIHVAPIHKMKLLICNLLAAFTVQLVGIALLLSYLYYVLKVNFGGNLYYVVITCVIASFLGVMLGAMITALIKKNENVKNSILLLFSVGGSFLAGLMIVDVKYIIETKAPIIAYINPASLITDALYRLYYYGPDNRFYTNITILAAMSVVFMIITYLTTRREEYASL